MQRYGDIIYRETFDAGPGGWIGWSGNGDGAQRLEIVAGAAVSRGPWWIDYNHAPPGGGYLHILYGLHTSHAASASIPYERLGGPNRFVDAAFPTDFTEARITVRLKGELDRRDAQLMLLAQANVGGIYVNYVLTGQPLAVTPDWSEQEMVLTPDPGQWQCLGSRRDRLDRYGDAPIGDVLRDLNADIIFVLYPLHIVPAEPLEADMHALRAGEEYAVNPNFLPAGYVLLDTVQIAFQTGESHG